MLEMLAGIAMGYIAFTEKGHKLGDSTMKLISENAKKVLIKNDNTQIADVSEPDE